MSQQNESLPRKYNQLNKERPEHFQTTRIICDLMIHEQDFNQLD